MPQNSLLPHKAPHKNRPPQTDYLAFILISILLGLILAIFILTIFMENEDKPRRIETTTLIEPIDHLRWASYGDSITDGGYWQAAITEYFALEHIEAGVSGSCLANNGGAAFCSAERLQDLVAAQPQLVSIMGGTNDYFSNVPLGDESEFSKDLESKNLRTYLGAYSYIVEYLRAALPETRLVLMTTPLNYSYFDGPMLNTEGLSIMDYANATALVAQHYQVVLVDMRDLYNEISVFTPDFWDGIHPNLEGAAKISQVFIQTMGGTK